MKFNKFTILGLVLIFAGLSSFSGSASNMIIGAVCAVVGIVLVVKWRNHAPKKKLKNSPAPKRSSSFDVMYNTNKVYKNCLVDEIWNVDSIRNDFIAVDVETTGLDPSIDRVVEISAQHFVNGEVIDSFTRLVNPGIKISNQASKINNITNKMLKDALPSSSVFRTFDDFIQSWGENIIFVAHNAKFDFNFIQAEYSRCGIDRSMRFIDTLELSRSLYPQQQNHKLDTIRMIHNIDCGDAHRAKSDAYTCGQFFIKAVQDMNKMSEVSGRSFSAEDYEICKYIMSILERSNSDIPKIHASKDKNNVVCIYFSHSEIFRFRNSKKLLYALLDKKYCRTKKIPVVAGNQSENDYCRYEFNNVSELDALEDYILQNCHAAQNENIDPYLAVYQYTEHMQLN